MKNNKKTIIELCMSPDLGGLELYMVRAAKALKEEFDVISIINNSSKLESYYDENDSYIKINKVSNIFMFSAAMKLAKIIDEKSVELIHLHWTKDIPFVVLAKILSKKKPKIVQTRHMTMTRFKDDFYHRFMYKNIDFILAVTYQVKEQLQKFIPQDIRPKIAVLYMGSDSVEMLNSNEIVNLKNEIGFKNTNFNIGMVGRINEAKGQHLLIKALANIKSQDAHADFVGHEMKEGYAEELKSLARELGVESRVHFLGFMKNPHHFFQVSDLIVMASKRETFGLVVIEAMQVQTAVVGSNSGGVVEIIDDGKTGLLFDVGNSESLALQIDKLMENPQLLRELAIAGQIKCEEKFSNKKQFVKLSNIFKGELNC
jgi:glycosyltransferase involved in cell wall biosynthesis